MPDSSQQRPTQDLDYEPIKKLENSPPPAPDEPKITAVRKRGSLLDKAKDLIQLIQQRPMIAHLLRAAERFNDRLGNQFGAAITYFSFLSMIPILMLSFAAAGFVLVSHPTLL